MDISKVFGIMVYLEDIHILLKCIIHTGQMELLMVVTSFQLRTGLYLQILTIMKDMLV